ncbi:MULTISPECIES: hypothetical protein [unclassified Streptomyces]|uniref:hypothetical protein n=1 Tax=unclassified Streptomyces TaxID=2593676 RepID=UPI0006F472AC|nr:MULTISPECIES: hypothetical protein [unclassified Streptomyces]KQX78940.1 hypothetical protein ASD26_10600 [Streptomyces sp. Root1319]KQZ03715.1 hypothetical protein ASD51_17930 [Streptomyces sp. Root55]
MPKNPPTTYRRIGALLHETGMVSEGKMLSTLEAAAAYADAELAPYAAARALESFGVAVSVHADDIDSIHSGYAGLLADAAEVAGGRVTISDVRIVEGEGGLESGRCDLLEFRRNAEPVSLRAEHFAVDYYDHEAACRAIAQTAHGDDPRSWRNADFAREPGAGYDSIMVLATPEQREALTRHLGLTFS